jgi:hypothetical protein
MRSTIPASSTVEHVHNTDRRCRFHRGEQPTKVEPIVT